MLNSRFQTYNTSCGGELCDDGQNSAFAQTKSLLAPTSLLLFSRLLRASKGIFVIYKKMLSLGE